MIQQTPSTQSILLHMWDPHRIQLNPFPILDFFHPALNKECVALTFSGRHIYALTHSCQGDEHFTMGCITIEHNGTYISVDRIVL